jgi:hypothetical protein
MMDVSFFHLTCQALSGAVLPAHIHSAVEVRWL